MAEENIADDSAQNPPAGDPPVGKPPAGDPPAAPVIPEQYADFTLPEGVTLDTALLDKALPVFKDLGLTQEQAQKLVGLQADRVTEMMQQQQQAYADQLKGWEDAVKIDKEIGGEAFDENLGLAKTALEKVGTPELKAFLEGTGAGSHPEVIRAFVRIGRLLKEDSPGSGTPPNTKKDIVDRWYSK